MIVSKMISNAEFLNNKTSTALSKYKYNNKKLNVNIKYSKYQYYINQFESTNIIFYQHGVK